MPRKMEFSGFLKAYCNSLCGLSGKPTTSVKKLYRRVSDDCPAAAEALFLYALDVGRVKELLDYVKVDGSGMQRFQSYGLAASLLRDGERAEAFISRASNELPPRFCKVHEAWLAIKKKRSADAHAKELMRMRIISLLEDAYMNPRKLCLEANLNEGNFYAFLKGDVTKLSRPTARRLLQTAERLCGPVA